MERSRLNLSCSHVTASAERPVKTRMRSSRASSRACETRQLSDINAQSTIIRTDFFVSSKKILAESVIPLSCCVWVPEPLIPDVALVELPPIKLKYTSYSSIRYTSERGTHPCLSSNSTLPPRSRMVCAAERPARPPPTMITWAISTTTSNVVVVVVNR